MLELQKFQKDLREDVTNALKQRLSTNEIYGVSELENSEIHSAVKRLFRKYEASLVSMFFHFDCQRKIKLTKVRKRTLDSFAARFIVALRATAKLNKAMRIEDIEVFANDLDFSKPLNEPIFFSALPSKPNSYRPICSPSLKRRANSYALMDLFGVLVPDSPFDSTVRGAGGISETFQSLSKAVEQGYSYFVVIDVVNFFPSLRPGHLCGFPLSKWVVENFIFPKPDAPMIFVDRDKHVRVSEGDIMRDEYSLPVDYHLNGDDIRSMLKKVRQGLLQGDVHAPRIARTVLAREVRLAVDEMGDAVSHQGIAVSSHLDDILLGAPSLLELQAALKALKSKLEKHPAGPLELHEHEVVHIKQGFEYVGYRVDLSGPNGRFHVRPTRKAFLKFGEKLFKRWEGSTVFTKHELREIAHSYARHWFASQNAWTHIGFNKGFDIYQTHSWRYVETEIEICLQNFIRKEIEEGSSWWHPDDVGEPMYTEM